MELNISELHDENVYDQIPENIPIKVTKKGNKVHFNNNPNPNPNTKPNTKSVLKKMVRPQVPAKKPQISYDDILSKMGMFVADGQLHLVENQPLQVQEQINQQINKTSRPVKQTVNYSQTPKSSPSPNPSPTPINANAQNSYIYNKYFSNEMQNVEGPRIPKNLLEYRNMLIHDIIQKQKAKQIKSTKLIMPTSNIHFAPYASGNMNKLFAFSNR
jgi:hypothetical protein